MSKLISVIFTLFLIIGLPNSSPFAEIASDMTSEKASLVKMKIEVSFSPKLEKYMDAINKKERSLERGQRSLNGSGINNLRGGNTDTPIWAVAQLFPNVEDYTVEGFTTAVVARNLRMAGLEEKRGTIRIYFDKIKLTYNGLKVLNGMQPYATGSIEFINEEGVVIYSKKVTANLFYIKALGKNKKLNGFYFHQYSSEQISPVIVSFIQKGLGKIFKDHKFYGVILIINGL